jgi:hypothetical protein
VRFPRLAPKDETCARKLADRTLTNLYNEFPTWLQRAHKELDEAVFAAYDWKPGMSDDETLARLLELNLSGAAGRAASPSGEVTPAARRAVVAARPEMMQ